MLIGLNRPVATQIASLLEIQITNVGHTIITDKKMRTTDKYLKFMYVYLADTGSGGNLVIKYGRLRQAQLAFSLVRTTIEYSHTYLLTYLLTFNTTEILLHAVDWKHRLQCWVKYS